MPPKPRHVRIKELNLIFESARMAAKHIDGDFSTVFKCLRDERLSHKGYTFEYVAD
jgi:hypothetical protein